MHGGRAFNKEMMDILLKLNNFIVMNRKILMERNMNVLIKTKMNMTIVSLVVKMEILSAFNWKFMEFNLMNKLIKINLSNYNKLIEFVKIIV